jgi:hypothetical protein
VPKLQIIYLIFKGHWNMSSHSLYSSPYLPSQKLIMVEQIEIAMRGHTKGLEKVEQCSAYECAIKSISNKVTVVIGL